MAANSTERTASSSPNLEPLEAIEYPAPNTMENGVRLPTHLMGWRLYLTMLCVCGSVFLPNLEVTIVSTALANISNDLSAFSESNWIIVGYLATYTGFMIVSAKLSDIVGRKVALMASLIMFITFSGACGGAKTITQLIVFRAFQGVGAAGCFSVASVVMYEMVPKQKYPAYTSIVSMIIALATLLGPILGGAIAEYSTWRWVFYINVPMGFVVVLLLAFSLPTAFPHHNEQATARRHLLPAEHIINFRRIDTLGTALFLISVFSLVSALLEATKSFPWSSAPIIVLLVASALSAALFLAWERRITLGSSKQEPIVPWRFFRNRAYIAELLVSLLLGVTLTVLVVTIPQKFQIVAELPPLQAGFRLLAYTVASPCGALFANILISHRKDLPIVLVTVTGACIQVAGMAMLNVYGTGRTISPKQYGGQIITGFGQGATFGSIIVMAPLSVDARDLATATGAVMLCRQLGGAIGLSIATTILNGRLESSLASALSPTQLHDLLQDSARLYDFPLPVQEIVKSELLAAYSLQLKVVLGFSVATVLSAAFIWKRKQIMVPEKNM